MGAAVNWQGFCKQSKSLVQGSFSFAALKSCLSLIDPKVFSELSFFAKTAIRIGLCRFVGQRNKLLSASLTAFAKKNEALFIQAPQEAVVAYNAIMATFFTNALKLTIKPLPQVQIVKPVEISAQERRQIVEKKMEEFRHDHAGVLPFLFKPYVEDFLIEMGSEMDRMSDMIACQERMLSALDVQKEALRRIDSDVRSDLSNMKKQSIPIIEKLYTAEFSPHKDLLLQIDKMLKAEYGFSLPAKKWLSQEVALEVDKARDAFFHREMAGVAGLIETAKNRNEKMQEMELFQKKVLNVVSRLKLYKDLAKEKIDLEERNTKITFTRKELLKTPPAEIEKTIAEKYAGYLALMSEIEPLVLGLNKRCEEIELFGEYGKQTIKRRLFEIFFGFTPYKELLEDLQNIRSFLVERLVRLIDSFYTGALRADEYLSQCQEMAYEHDVVKFRNEISYRSTRVKDIRDEVIHLFKELSGQRRLLDVIPGAVQEKVYRDTVRLLQEVKELLGQIENPFQLFAKATTKDDTNLVFRSMWIQVEKIQQQTELLKAQAEPLLKKNAEAVKTALLRVVDLVEEVVYQSEGSRPVLVAQLKSDFGYVPQAQLWAALMEKIQGLEKKYPFMQPCGFFLQITDTELCLDILKEARQIEERVSGIRSFAKAMQFVKTFEEEYVDIILEAFERQYLLEENDRDRQSIKDAWKRYSDRMYASCGSVEEEVLLDIGLLDMRALMDVDQSKLQKILKIAVDRALAHIQDPQCGLVRSFAQMEKSGTYASTAHDGLRLKAYQQLKDKMVALRKEPATQKDSCEILLGKLRLFCLYLFDLKVFMASVRGYHLAKSLVFVAELRTLTELLEDWLKETRRRMGAVWDKSWIAETDVLRREIAHFEMQVDGSESLKVFMEKVFGMISQIQEVIHTKAQDPINLQMMMKEIEQHLQEIQDMEASPAVQFPFFYMPGYLAFFDETKHEVV